MEKIVFNGWRDCVRLSNAECEIVVTTQVGPRIMRFGFTGERNLLTEFAGQQGGANEPDFQLRGGHRLWLAPEDRVKTYELDNSPVAATPLPGGGALIGAPPGALTGVAREMEIVLDPAFNRVRIRHRLINRGATAVNCAPWALTIMAAGGTALIPLPPKIPHTERLTHNQEWSIWGYTDLGDPRWTITPAYLFSRQDAARGPGKIGIAHREGWVAYMLEPFLFVKRFAFIEGALYPDGGVNFETFSNEDFLELESLGQFVRLETGAAIEHDEEWLLFRGVPACRTPADVERHILPRLREAPPPELENFPPPQDA